MGHKVHPIGFRLGIIKDWQSRWFAEKNYTKLLAEDFRLRAMIKTKLANAGVSKVEIERAAANQVAVTIHTAKPGIVIGKSGQAVEELRQSLERETKKKVRLNIHEIRQPELDAYLVGRSVAEQLEKRISFRRAMKQSVQRTMRTGAKGIKIIVGGRLGGAEIARTEKEVEGKVPLHTLRADIDYANTEAHTTFGVIGIKVWIYRGEVLPGKRRSDGSMQGAEVVAPAQSAPRSGDDRRPGGPGGQRRPRRDGAPAGGAGGYSGGGSFSTGGRPTRPPRPSGAPGAPRAPRPEGGRPPLSGGLGQPPQFRPATSAPAPATPAAAPTEETPGAASQQGPGTAERQ